MELTASPSRHGRARQYSPDARTAGAFSSPTIVERHSDQVERFAISSKKRSIPKLNR
jgi:hypothetical protein